MTEEHFELFLRAHRAEPLAPDERNVLYALGESSVRASSNFATTAMARDGVINRLEKLLTTEQHVVFNLMK